MACPTPSLSPTFQSALAMKAPPWKADGEAVGQVEDAVDPDLHRVAAGRQRLQGETLLPFPGRAGEDGDDLGAFQPDRPPGDHRLREVHGAAEGEAGDGDVDAVGDARQAVAETQVDQHPDDVVGRGGGGRCR
jgi:hypothetical protein